MLQVMLKGTNPSGSFVVELQTNPVARVILLLVEAVLNGQSELNPSISKHCAELDAQFESDHRRRALLDALRLRRKWRTADIPRLEQLDLPPVALRKLEELRRNPRKGRGVIREFVPAAEILRRGLCDDFRRVDLDTPPHERLACYKKTRWFPEFVEAAYRGELKLAKQRVAASGSRAGRPHELAESAVAEAAGISPALVRRYCHQERMARRGLLIENAAAPTSAAELKRHLEHGLPPD